MWFIVLYSSYDYKSFATFSPCSNVGAFSYFMKIFIEGVLIFLATFNISFNLGTPSVTLCAEFPAKWNVFNVIWVVGSPNDYAQIIPTVSPGWTWALVNLLSISPKIS